MRQWWGEPVAGRRRGAPSPLRRWTAGAATVGVVVAGLASFGVVGAAQAAPGDGKIQVRVVQDFNGDGEWDDSFSEPGMADVDVVITDVNGAVVAPGAKTNAEGVVEVELAPGDYRVVVDNPDATVYQPAPAREKTGTAETPDDEWLSANEEFLTVRRNATTQMVTAFWDVNDYCQSNPLIVTACQPAMFTPAGKSNRDATRDTLVTAPYRAEGTDVGKTTLSTSGETGSLYGIGYRQADRRVFAGAFAKRGSDYGPDGPGAIYVTSADGGATTLWGTVSNVGTSTHTYDELPGGRTDWNFAPAVGKESLGDLDISEDGDDLQVINLFTRELLVFDAAAPTMGAPTHTVDLKALAHTCAAPGDWRPAALGERHGTLYVGGVCTAESTQLATDMKALVFSLDADTYDSPQLVMDQRLDYRRANNGGSGCSGRPLTTYRPWSDNGIECGNKSGQIPDPQAWMTDIVIENNGDLILGFRDRTGDQQLGRNSQYFADTTGTGGTPVGQVNYNVTGDINKACWNNTTNRFELDVLGACGVAAVADGAITNEYFKGDGTVHPEAAFGGLALSRGERGVATSIMDPWGIFSQGYASIARGSGGALETIGNGASGDPDEIDTTGAGQHGNKLDGATDLGKGQGIADMEVLCDLAPIQIGNRVWDDANGDGIQDAGEAGIAGVTVSLYEADGTTPVMADYGDGLVPVTTVTNSRGEYYFDSITDGVDFNTNYVIRLDKGEDYDEGGPLEGKRLSAANAGANDRVDSDGVVVAGGQAQASIRTGDRGDNDHTIDFGFSPASVSVGNFVWVDSDGDGIQEAGEPGIKGVVLELTRSDGQPVVDINGDQVGPITTDENGHYLFENLPILPAGAHYTVTIDEMDPSNVAALAPYEPTVAGAGSDPAKDSSTWTADAVELTQPGDRDLTLDFGFSPIPVSVGNLVWVDLDGDGLQSPGEPGIPGVKLTLTDPNGDPVTTDKDGNPFDVVTDANGHYVFSNLPVLGAGESYTVHVDNSQPALAAYLPTDVVGNEGDGDNSSTGSAASTVDLTVPGASDMTLDFGFVPARVSVGDLVWTDSDRDGIQDPGEPGIQGVVMVLTDEDGNPVTDVFGNTVGPVTTDADGNYVFANLPVLPAGEHYVVSIDRDAPSTIVALGDLVPTAAGQGSDPADDSSTWTAESGDLTTNGAEDMTLDFGFVRPRVSVGNFVWDDLDNDGIQETGEPGIEGVVLVLTGPDGGPVRDVNGDVVGPVTTGPNGGYSFDDLPVLPAGQSYTVSIDRDHASTKDALALYLPTVAEAGADRAVDSSTWTADSGDLTSDGAADRTLDFGFFRPEVSVGDKVWFDNDHDGIQEPGEPGIRGVVLQLTGPDGNPVRDIFGNVVAPVTTNAAGEYSFDHLPPLPAGQSYTVTVNYAASAAALSGLAPTRTGQGTPATDSSTGSASSGDLTAHGDRDDTLDFGFYQVPGVSVGDFVWEDLDQDGQQDAGEPGIRGVVLVLTGPDGQPVRDVNGAVVGPVTTDANGRYSFDNLPTLPAGQGYTVTVDQDASAAALADLTPTRPGQGNSGNDSSTGSATSGNLTSAGDRDATLDFGFVRPAVSVGDLVWVDTDKDGQQDAGEPGLPGVVLVLTGPDGKPVTDVHGKPVGPVTTGADGRYSFDNLPPLPAGQHYTVSIDRTASAAALAGYGPTKPGVGNPDSDSSSWTATSKDLVNNGDRDSSLDFGFTTPAVSVGDLVWRDNDKDGVQDAGEPGIPGVVLVLTGPDGKPVTDLDGNPVGPVTTDADGRYSFDNLPPLAPGQSYTVTVDVAASSSALGGLVPTLPGQGTPGSDSSTGSASSGDLVNEGDRDDTLDFGFTTPAQVDGTVWVDNDKDGQPDAGEPRLPGVVLVLTGPDGKPVTDLDGNPVGPVTTDADGNYSFDNLPLLPPGQEYVVTIDVTASAGVLSDYRPGAADGDLDFAFLPVTQPEPGKKPKLKTKTKRNVVAKVNGNGSMRAVNLRDTVIIKRLKGAGEGVARLYGPTSKRSANMCTPGNLVGTVKFTARNGKQKTPTIKVTQPGVYTWVVSIKGKNGQQVSHKCGVKSETTRVRRQGYGPVKIETGVKPSAAAKVGSAGVLGISTIGLNNAPVRVVGVRNGEMVIPNGAKEIGWLNRSAQFGDAIGTSVVAAHVSDNSDRPMAFWKLKNLKKGKIVTVKKGGETYRYKVTAKKKFSRDRGPGIPKRFFKTTGAHRLVLVTCTDKVTYPGGSFHYTNNLVVVAKQVK